MEGKPNIQELKEIIEQNYKTRFLTDYIKFPDGIKGCLIFSAEHCAIVRLDAFWRQDMPCVGAEILPYEKELAANKKCWLAENLMAFLIAGCDLLDFQSLSIYGRKKEIYCCQDFIDLFSEMVLLQNPDDSKITLDENEFISIIERFRKKAPKWIPCYSTGIKYPPIIIMIANLFKYIHYNIIDASCEFCDRRLVLCNGIHYENGYDKEPMWLTARSGWNIESTLPYNHKIFLSSYAVFVGYTFGNMDHPLFGGFPAYLYRMADRKHSIELIENLHVLDDDFVSKQRKEREEHIEKNGAPVLNPAERIELSFQFYHPITAIFEDYIKQAIQDLRYAMECSIEAIDEVLCEEGMYFALYQLSLFYHELAKHNLPKFLDFEQVEKILTFDTRFINYLQNKYISKTYDFNIITPEFIKYFEWDGEIRTLHAYLNQDKPHKRTTKKNAKIIQSFASSIQNVDADKFLTYLHKKIDGNGGKEVACILGAAIYKYHYLSRVPSETEFMAEFPNIKSTFKAIKHQLNLRNEQGTDSFTRAFMLIDIPL